MEEKKWYRVIDPLSPLYGCDVLLDGHRVWGVEWAVDADESFYRVVAMRRVDVFVGDRPFQLVAKDGQDLGLMISNACFAASPVQDEIVVTGTDRPHGLCLDESEMTREDGATLRIARYEKATQIAVEDADDGLLASETDSTEARAVWESVIIGLFESGEDVGDIVYALRKN